MEFDSFLDRARDTDGARELEGSFSYAGDRSHLASLLKRCVGLRIALTQEDNKSIYGEVLDVLSSPNSCWVLIGEWKDSKDKECSEQIINLSHVTRLQLLERKTKFSELLAELQQELRGVS